jgi:hypothetical protein
MSIHSFTHFSNNFTRHYVRMVRWKGMNKSGQDGAGVMAHIYNFSYSRDREREDCCLRPAQGPREVERPHLKKQAGCGGMHLSSQLCGRP